jgi:uncharacterized surface protein with fasciclin (FAS1) repeats
MIRVLLLAAFLLQSSFAFQTGAVCPRATLRLFETEKSSEDTKSLEDLKAAGVERFLKKKFPSFSKLLMNDEMRKSISEGKTTVFVPSEAAFEQLGEKKIAQIKDPRNGEIQQKMGSYHLVCGKSIPAIELRTEDWTKGRPKDGSKPNTRIAGVNTLSGEVPVGRSKSGGFLGFGAKEDGDIVVGPKSKIVQSFLVQESMIHEMDGLVSPDVLWRYCDQLRIPGF